MSGVFWLQGERLLESRLSFIQVAVFLPESGSFLQSGGLLGRAGGRLDQPLQHVSRLAVSVLLEKKTRQFDGGFIPLGRIGAQAAFQRGREPRLAIEGNYPPLEHMILRVRLQERLQAGDGGLGLLHLQVQPGAFEDQRRIGGLILEQRIQHTGRGSGIAIGLPGAGESQLHLAIVRRERGHFFEPLAFFVPFLRMVVEAGDFPVSAEVAGILRNCFLPALLQPVEAAIALAEIDELELPGNRAASCRAP
ncbi:MAG: hypothetical protein QM796_14895 [Chthoniobacteraceae bacterium]